MLYGYVKNWNPDKGWGFIVTEDDEDLFFHLSDLDITLKPEQLHEGLRVKFDVKSDIKGDKAVNVRKA